MVMQRQQLQDLTINTLIILLDGFLVYRIITHLVVVRWIVGDGYKPGGLLADFSKFVVVDFNKFNLIKSFTEKLPPLPPLLTGLLLPLTGCWRLPLVVEDCQYLSHSPAKLINCTICDSVTPLFNKSINTVRACCFWIVAMLINASS